MLPPAIGHDAFWKPEGTLISLNAMHLGDVNMQVPKGANMYKVHPDCTCFPIIIPPFQSSSLQGLPIGMSFII